ncbi:class I SAM-dependent methyltransferase [Helicobacter sp. MIT 00-7814]|uniref:class I SAM-dependent methyltransferase n=1 Tax=Helicobacter sp. MIT 00-7814 TaxID=2040650 RepID=UPI002162F285|nr:class I SAM-dependent methyltransferase [Helicobacter sp. MIT 00-7814]
MNCYLCDSVENFQRDGKVRDNPNIKILECSNCGLVFLNTNEADEEFYKHNKMNDADFFKFAQRDYGTDTQQAIRILSKDRESQIKRRLEFVQNTIIGKDLLDFGSGRAEFLIMAKEFAKSVVGVEIEEQVETIYKENDIRLARSIADLGGGGI